MGRLSTHILDTSHGGPAAGVALRLFAFGDERRQVSEATTNADGRTDSPLLQGDETRGCYELEFDIGDYFRGRGVDLSDPPFLDTVVIRFTISDDEDYHVPLLASPWSYSTYRGS